MWIDGIICCCFLFALVDASFLSTPSGNIQGTTVTIENATVYQYRKIPFAKAPVGELRFKKPVPYGKWNGTLNATVFGPSCMQFISASFYHDLLPNKDISEDCLYLNVYVPNNAFTNSSKSVMIWIHGGAFLFGQATVYDASYLAKYGDVIVVTINYRLGVFGFLTTSDSVSVGNYGLWDQKLAIQWVHDNIAAFGGDSNSVTIFGESAGGISVGLQAIQPSNKGLFQRVIAESGVAFSFATYTRDAEVLTNIFFRNLNCSIAKTAIIIDKSKCLQIKTSNEILKADTDAREQLPIRLGLGLGPVIDGDFITDDPIKLISKHTSTNVNFFQSLDYMTGTMDSEGSLVFSFTGPQLQKEFNFDIKQEIPTRALCKPNGLASLLTKENYNRNNNIDTAICNKYKTESSLDEQSRKVVQFYGDSLFVAPAVQSLNIHSGGNNGTSTYQYLFTRIPELPSSKPEQAWFRGARHASELFFLFGMQKFPTVDPSIKLSTDDLLLSKRMMIYWSNFAKTGDPNDLSTDLPFWPRYDASPDSHEYLKLDVNITQGSNLYEDQVKFWLQTVPGIHYEINNGRTISVYYLVDIVLVATCVSLRGFT